MNTYHINEGTFDVPDNLEDETTHVLGWPPSDNNSSPFTLTIDRDVLQQGETLRSYIKNQLDNLKNNLKDFTLIRHDTGTISGRNVEKIEYVWEKDDAKIVQQQVYLANKNNLLIFTATMFDEFTSSGSDMFRKIISTFKFRKWIPDIQGK